jgi:hypothetical protein
MSFRVDIQGRTKDEPEKIGIIFENSSDVFVSNEDDDPTVRALVELSPDDALELAAQLFETHARTRGYLTAQDMDGDQPTTEEQRERGLTVESWRLRVLLEAGFALDDAERLAAGDVDLRRAELLARDAGPKLAAEILS